MKKLLLICCAFTMMFSLFGCKSNPEGKYSMNGSVALGAVDSDSLDKTRVTYTVTISGNKQDIENVVTQEPLINMEYGDLLLENGPHNIEIKDVETKNPYLEISGNFVFDTKNKTKEEIDAMKLFQGIKIVDKDKEEFVLNFNYSHTK
jgi:hypothetical protein